MIFKDLAHTGFVIETWIQLVEYFDPFGLIMPSEALKYFNTSGKQIVYSIDEIQNRNTVLLWLLVSYTIY